MNILDIIFLVPLAWFAYKGFQKGFIIELCSLIALVLGIYFAINFSNYASDLLVNNFDIGEKYLSITAFVITFIAVIAGVFFIGKVLEKFIDVLMLGFINQIVGAAFGILKAAFLISIIIWIINSFDFTNSIIKSEQKDNSFLYENIEMLAPTIIPKLNVDKLKDFELEIPSTDELKKKVGLK